MLEKNQNNIEELINSSRLVDAGVLLLLECLERETKVEGINREYLIRVCRNQFIAFTNGYSEEKIKTLITERNALFFNKLAVMTSLMIKLNLINYESIEGGLPIFDTRSMLAVSILETYNSINAIYCKNDPSISLIPDLFSKTINQCLGIVKMLNLGLLSDSFGAWRTLHESICIIKILIDGGKEVQDEYINHIVYTNAYRGGISDKEENDKIFEELKSKMKKHGLKSKDMKKFIEYGWIYAYKKFDEKDPLYRLNFRDGVQKCAELSDFNEWYEISSELSHSSAIFFYSKEEYFLNLIVHGLYEMLLVLDKEFYKYYSKEILSMPSNFVVNYTNFKNALIEIASKQEDIFNKEYFGVEDVD